MRLQRFIGLFVLTNSSLTIVDRETLNQLKNVFRFKPGDRFVLCDGKGTEAEVMIETIDAKSCNVKIEKTYQNENEPRARVHLFCSILKRENFELVVQKATEIGVAEITPLLCDRTVKMNLNLERLGKIAHEAAEQSGRGIVPTIHEPQSFKNLLTNPPTHPLTGTKILFDSSGVDFQTCPVIRPDTRSNDRVTFQTCNVFIGPEGGWTPEELALAKSQDFQIASLGQLTLRGETAAIVASYVCVNMSLRTSVSEVWQSSAYIPPLKVRGG